MAERAEANPVIGRALRAHSRSFIGDIVLLWAAVAACALSLSLAMSIPPDIADATGDLRAELTAPFGVVLATYGAVLAAVYGSFRYTADRRDGVVAQRLMMMQPRWAMLLARMPTSALGGAMVALAAVVGGHVALAVSMGGIPIDPSSVGFTLVLGALSGLWGMGLGVIVQAHLLALFVVPLSMGAAMLVAMFWPAVAVYLPLPAMLEALRFDVTAVGILPDAGLDTSVAVLVTVGWMLAALLIGGFCFMRRDVK